ncbi:2-hydroxyacid dehydrogenase [Salimicrobium flavidum]|uniref:Glyoxylate reductase n=1 Tax=Salimicrobium flavidum TaxID=570947 RepID=A0A1N7J3A5_9BACI|nr:D-glycerate dehydrogenase [Salimicrobium flavidum]SIS43845.1 glyoxylate reductase [Salimicrobium flavidum]
MQKPKVYITRPLPEEVVEPYRGKLDIEMYEVDEPIPAERLSAQVKEVDALIPMLSEKLGEEFFRETSAKVVANLAVGFDNIDVEAARKYGVTVTNTPDVLTETTADLTFALMLNTARRITEAEAYIKEDKWKQWSPLQLAGTDVHHKTMGIVGMGRIGEAVAQRAKGFSMDILYHNRSRKTEAEEELGARYVSFDELLEKSDYVVCMTPFTEETRHLFGEETFRKMKRDAYFINTSRGKTVDEEALYQALEKGEIKGCGLDVFEEEPISSSHPLLQMQNVTATPHIGSSSVETRYRMMQLCLDNCIRVLSGEEPITPVT